MSKKIYVVKIVIVVMFIIASCYFIDMPQTAIKKKSAYPDNITEKETVIGNIKRYDYVDENGTKKTLICVPASKVEKVLKEEVDMGQVPAVSDKRSTAADIPDNVRKEIRKLRQQIGEFDDEGKDTTELQKRLKDLKNKYCS
jgi:hypothetical protein